MNVFDIIGPIMIGPSSSHTAGAARIGRMVREILGEDIASAEVTLFSSFAQTGVGHGTDKAIAAGLMGYPPDSSRIRNALEVAAKKGIPIHFIFSDQDMGHPNVAEIKAVGVGGNTVDAIGRSLGGGRIKMTQIDGFPVEISGDEYTLLTRHRDIPGIVAQVCQVLASEHINISTMRVFRRKRGDEAIMMIHTDEKVNLSVVEQLKNCKDISRVMAFDRV